MIVRWIERTVYMLYNILNIRKVCINKLKYLNEIIQNI